MSEKSFSFFRSSIENDPQKTACLGAIRIQTSLITLSFTISLLLLYLLQTAGVWLLVHLATTLPKWLSVEALGEFFTILLYPIAFLLPFLGLAKVSGFSPQKIPRRRPYLPITFAAAGICLGSSALLSAVLLPVTAPFLKNTVTMIPADPLARGLSMINMVLLPAFIEEVVYRGILLEILRRFGDRLAIIVCAVLFALMHRNLLQLPNALLMGLLLGYFVVQTSSIWTGIVIHLCNNLLVFFWELFLIGQLPIVSVLLQILRFGLFVSAGFLGAIYLWKIHVPFGIRCVYFPIGERQRLLVIFLHPSMLVLFVLFGWIFYLGTG